VAVHRRTRLTRQERRELLVDAAARVFTGRDPAEVTFEEIADEAGVSRALVYNYFGDRNGIVEAVAARSGEQLRAQVADALATTPGLREALYEVVRTHLRFARQDPTGYRLAAGELAPTPVDRVIAERVSEVEAVLGGGPEARLVAAGVVAATHALVLHHVGPEGTDDDGTPKVSDERAAALIAAFFAGAYDAVGRLGLTVRPMWPVPDAARA
jgi:AcrR family transcriptional regulator